MSYKPSKFYGVLTFPSFVLYYFLLSKLYAQCGAHTHNPEIKYCTLYQLSQPGASPSFFIQEKRFGSILRTKWDLQNKELISQCGN